MRIEGVIATTASASQAAPQKALEAQPKEVSDRATLQAASQTVEQEDAVGERLLSQAVDQANEVLNAFDEVLNIKVHKETKRFIIKLVNKESGEVIREYPPEKFLDMMANFQKQIAGLFVDTER